MMIFRFGTNEIPMRKGAGGLLMKLILSDGGRAIPVHRCELCLQPMRHVCDQAERRLFKCDDCALVSTEVLMLGNPGRK
ncbi:hypothetical protein CT676_42890 [Bradyrhizobium sp. MOS001]|uniref:hypothetical protein n=1 Tax=Bradyrhizobium TaxID=374 RepID=UPI001074E1EA|nr:MULTISPECIES: hypothetical protein [Bradyrhizobium]MCS3897387.1 hypothetical protein [Bradyrhizobium japonicum USDA 38]MCS3949902.1 hypothetical protein [Bradyrhizobium japonicum]TFW52023.1 hypothetical protein CT676_42890 [Bradyrhizobium sp. MOS001]